MAVTLADVAARAGVSPATVSRVLSGRYRVTEGTRGRVLRAVAELEYVVDGPASALAGAGSDLVGILVNDIADPFFGVLAGAVQGELGGAAGPGGEKLAVVCSTGGSPERELDHLTHLQRQRAAAVVLTGGAPEDPEHARALSARLARLTEAGTRVVLCGRPRPEPPGAQAGEEAEETPPRFAGRPPAAVQPVTLAFDNRGGARRLTGHLLALGHRRIGCVAGPAGRTTTAERLAGHRDALAAHGVADVPERTVPGAYDRASGYDAALELLRREPALTAVVAANDTAALGVCAALRDRGLRIPEDVSVTGFDDLPFSADATPALTTARLPLREAGARAGRLAVGRAAAPPGGVATLPAELLVRESTGPVRSGGPVDGDRRGRPGAVSGGTGPGRSGG
ncbi:MULTISPECIES: LacI family DNA-binding transcriptional regulator [unclassified Streptomyces]|uniref:LacI family DNA-binding transcriptional regulator n=1 Tax=unclassified Streptomyces TaxID=2593676 RepID=UPI00037C4448|nr:MULTISPECIES: LacI family DNA-binding transcriptional regulator [unclassified Streptomyces]MYT28212.1 substrate-binding domain-containing protein [Streptomyces sp. SID8354]